jgi:hypothetical protein
LPGAVPDGEDGVEGDCVPRFCVSVVVPDPLVEPEPLVLPEGLAVLPLPAGWLALSRSQPGRRAPASASAKEMERIRFMGVAPFGADGEQQPRLP